MAEANTTEQTYFQERMTLLGVTDELNTIKLWYNNTEGPTHKEELQDVNIFRETDRGIDILVYTIDRLRINYAKEGSRFKRNEYCITRLKEPREKKDGSIQKYDMPKGHPVLPFFPPGLVEKYDAGTKIPILYLTEGYFKAFKAQMHGIDCIGLPSITCMKEKETGALHEGIKKVIIKCQVERIVWLTDGDCINVTSKEIKDGTDLYKRPQQFFRTVATFYDLLSKFEDVQKYFAHINSEGLEGNPKGLDDLLCAFPDDHKAIVRDFHSFDKIKGSVTPGTYLMKMNITWGLGGVHKYFMLHDVDVFYQYHAERRSDLKNKEFKFNGTLYTYDGDKQRCIIKIPSDASRYFRVGDKYYEYVDIPNKYGELTKTFHRREKETIKDDNGKDIFRHIPKYKAFCNVPDHINYQRVIDSCFNIYSPFDHEMDEGSCDVTLGFIKHIFGEEEVIYKTDTGEKKTVPRWQLGLDYLTLLYKRPQQILPILCLVSSERQTGKTTFAKWLNMIFTENMAIVGNEDLANPFNSHWATKLLITCDETKIDKHTVIEKVKSLSTSNQIMMNAKGRDQVNMEFFGKFIFLSNNEDNFINIDEQEIRFWIIKVPTIKMRNVDLLNDLLEEIPAFLSFLNSRQMVTANRERHWFDSSLLKTAALERVVANSKPSLEKQLKHAITEFFTNTELDTITIPLKAIATEVLKRPADRDYIKRILHNMGYRTIGPDRRDYPRFIECTTEKGIDIKCIPVRFHDRYYEFHRHAFVELTEPLDDLPF